MSNIIKAQGKIILSCSNVLFNALYNSLVSLIKQTEYEGNCKITQFIHDLDQENVGLGYVSVDISDYNFDKQDMQTLIDLVRGAVESVRTSPQFGDVSLMRLEKFLGKLSELSR